MALAPAPVTVPRSSPSDTRGAVAMIGWVEDIEKATEENETFRTVLFTGVHTQLTVMSIPRGEDIGREVHHDRDQFLRVEQGTARVELGGAEDAIDETHEVEADWAMVIPAGIWHNVVNTGHGELKLYSLYSPPEHPDGTVHRTKADAEAAEHAHQAA
jgi:mannose-6-phosphate isomerase-like protein (cupin superfamily)